MFDLRASIPRPDPLTSMFGRPIVAGQITDDTVGSFVNPVVFAVGARPAQIEVYVFDSAPPAPVPATRPFALDLVVAHADTILTGLPCGSEGCQPFITRRMAMADLSDPADGIPDIVAGDPRSSGPVEVYTGSVDGGQLTYTRTAVLTLPTLPSRGFGESIAATNSHVVVGAPGGISSKRNPKNPVGHVAVYSAVEINAAAGGVVVTGAFPGGDSDDGFGAAVAIGSVTGDNTLDLIVGATGVDGNGGSDVGEVWVFEDFFNGGGPDVSFLAETPVQGDQFGWQVAAAGNQVVGVKKWSSSAPLAEVHDLTDFSPDPNPILLAPLPGDLGNGWASHPLGVGNVNGNHVPDILIGAPNARCGADASVGLAYLYLDSSPIDPESPTNVVAFQPPSTSPPVVDRAWNVFGWSTVIVNTVGGRAFVIIGEPGRDLTGNLDGQVYIYTPQ